MYNEKNYFTFNYNHLYIFRISRKKKLLDTQLILIHQLLTLIRVFYNINVDSFELFSKKKRRKILNYQTSK
jgi:hypothetical protein